MKKIKIWESESSSEDSTDVYESFFKSSFFVNSKKNGTGLLRTKKYRDEEEQVGPSVGLRDTQAEAQLFAQLVQQTKPIGLTNEEIEHCKSLGYVMSGIRYTKNVQQPPKKKEGVTYTAEEKRALAIYNLEEQMRRERNIINEMKNMWQNKKDDDDNNN